MIRTEKIEELRTVREKQSETVKKTRRQDGDENVVTETLNLEYNTSTILGEK